MAELTITFEDSVEYDLYNSDVLIPFIYNYDIVKKIHQGTLSQVFIISEKATGEILILKAIPSKQNFCDAALFKKINHPNIEKILDTFETEKYTYIIKEYIKGITLDKYVNKSGPLSEKEAVDIAFSLCDIIGYLHSINSMPIIYRDLKPANIIIDEYKRIKLIDLESIRQYKNDSKKDTIYIGTEGFAPPEQFGFGQTDIRSDIYTFGTTIYYLVTGQEPIVEKTKIQSIKVTRKDISSKLSKIVDKCAMFDPDNRYQSIDELLKELKLHASKNIIIKLLHWFRHAANLRHAMAIFALIAILSIYLANELPQIYGSDSKNNPVDSLLEANSNVISYELAVGASEPVFYLDKIGIDSRSVQSIQLKTGEMAIPVQFNIDGDKLSLINPVYPANLLDTNNEYTLFIYTLNNMIHKVDFKPVPQELKENGYRIIYIQAEPEKGFNYPYYLMLPSEESRRRNIGNRNYLLVEPYDMGLASDDMSVHINLALQNTKNNSSSIAEDFGFPRIVPIFIRPESSFNGKDIYTHTLSRNTILLDSLKKNEPWGNRIFETMDRMDLQLIAMTDHAREYLAQNAWQLEEKLFMWGTGSAGDFVNRFTFLHPERVKAAFYQSLPCLPMANVNNTDLPYPFGTSDYEEIAGKEFNIAAYNEVAKLGFIFAEYNENPVYPDMINSPEETQRILDIIPVQDYPDKWDTIKNLYQEVGLDAQVILYGDHSFVHEDSMNFLRNNIEADIPVYSQSNNTRAMTAVFNKGKLETMGEIGEKEISQRATINEAFWSGIIPKTLSQLFIDFYVQQPANNYNPAFFHISILEWDNSRDHTQMGERVRQLGGKITLKADGYKEVDAEITEGSMTFQGHGYVYVARIFNEEDMVSGVKYRIVEETGNWIINDDVFVVRPVQ